MNNIMKVVTYLLILNSFWINAQLERSIPDPGPAPEIKFKKPITIELTNGLTLMIVQDNKLPTAGATLIIDNPPILSKGKTGLKGLLSANLGKGNKFQSKEDFIEEKDFMGSAINYNSSGGSVSSLSRYFERSLSMFAQGALYPKFSEEEFVKEKIKLIESLKFDEKNASTIARRVEDIIAFGKNHPRSEYATQESVSLIELDDVKSFYKTYFRPNNAYLVIIGDIDVEKTIDIAEKLFGNWEESSSFKNLFGTESVNNFVEPTESDIISLHVIDVPNSSNVEVTFQNIISRTLKDDNYFSSNIANRVLGARPESRLETVIREDNGFAYYARSILPSSSNSKTKFRAITTVRDEVVDSAVVEIYNQLKKMSRVPITDVELENAKSAYFGSFAMSMENSVTIANQALNIRTENLPEDFYITFLSRINNVSKEEVMKSSKNFIKADNSQIIITGKVGNILDKIESISLNGDDIPVFYHNEFGEITERPDYSFDSSITAEDVIDNYINAIGGKEVIESISSIETNATANIQGTVLEMYSLKNNQNQSLLTMSAMGMQIVKSVFNKYQGYNEINGQKIPLEDKELEQAIINSALFSELNFDYDSIELVGTSSINDEKVYEIKPTNNKSIFYSIESGLKIKEFETQEVEGNLITTEIFYNNYEEFEGIMLPNEITQISPSIPVPGGITFKTTSVKLNIETEDSDFN